MQKIENYTKTTYDRALQAIESGKPNQAKILLQNIIITNPAFIPALNDLAVLYFNEGEYEQSIQLFQKIENIDPDVDYFKENYGQVLNALNLTTNNKGI
jgi:tetratricopeptide (TPR) repeat protein